MFKKYVQRKLEKLVAQYFRAHPEVKLIIVVGSVGKTTTKNAIATLLAEKYRVGGGFENHNSELSAPTAILGIKFPKNVRKIGEWLRVIRAAKLRVKRPATVDVIVQELATDKPGDIPNFGRYLQPDIAVVTAVSAEHMEFFKTMEAVAKEELSAVNFSKRAIINRDDIPGEYARFITNPNIVTYGSSQVAENSFIVESFDIQQGYRGRFIGPKAGKDGFVIEPKVYGEQSLRPVTAAVTAALEMGLNADQIAAGVKKIHPTPGRMNILPGLRGVTIIDDSYNSSPASASEALRALYSFDSVQRIAVLGSMNEMGDMSADAHKMVGELCDPNKLSWVITVGDEANQFLAPAAQSNGCQVKSFRHAIEAGGFVNQVMKSGAIVLFKGSQNKIFLEEAIKIILASTTEEANLIRQSPEWLARKSEFFASFSDIQEEDD